MNDIHRMKTVFEDNAMNREIQRLRQALAAKDAELAAWQDKWRAACDESSVRFIAVNELQKQLAAANKRIAQMETFGVCPKCSAYVFSHTTCDRCGTEAVPSVVEIEIAKLVQALAATKEQFGLLKSECDGVSDSYVCLRDEYDDLVKQIAQIQQHNAALTMLLNRTDICAKVPCPRKLEAETELAAANEQIKRLQIESDGHKQHSDAVFAAAQKCGLSEFSSEAPAGWLAEQIGLLRAAIATPDKYAGIISDVVEKDFAEQIKQLKEQNAALKARVEVLEGRKVFPNPLQLQIDDRILVSHFRDADGACGILFQDTGNHHEPGGIFPDEMVTLPHLPEPGELYLRFSRPGSAVVVLEALSSVLCSLAGMPERADIRITEMLNPQKETPNDKDTPTTT